MKPYDAAAKTVDDWNSKYPPGTPVIVLGDIKGDIRRTLTRSIAWVLGGHTPVVQVQGITGCYSLERVVPNDDVLPGLIDWLFEMHKSSVRDSERQKTFNEVLEYLRAKRDQK